MEIALGWLGWTEEEALSADMNAIFVGQAGLKKKLQFIYGKPDGDTSGDTSPSPRKPSADDIKRFAAQQNALRAGRKFKPLVKR